MFRRRISSKSIKNRLESLAHNWFGERARRVVRSATPSFIGGLKDHRASWYGAWRRVARNLAVQCREKFVNTVCNLQGLFRFATDFLTRLLSKPLRSFIW